MAANPPPEEPWAQNEKSGARREGSEGERSEAVQLGTGDGDGGDPVLPVTRACRPAGLQEVSSSPEHSSLPTMLTGTIYTAVAHIFCAVVGAGVLSLPNAVAW